MTSDLVESLTVGVSFMFLPNVDVSGDVVWAGMPQKWYGALLTAASQDKMEQLRNGSICCLGIRKDMSKETSKRCFRAMGIEYMEEKCQFSKTVA